MPPSGRKATSKARAKKAPATETNDHSDADSPEAIATPSRGSRKRARGSEAIVTGTRGKRSKVKDTRALEREDTDGTEPHDQSDYETAPTTPNEQEIIARLKVSDKHVNATEDYANELLEGQDDVPGFGKIAGRDWVYIIRKLEINIGRPEAQERLAGVDGESARNTPTAKTVVDIDLGPDRQISRLHAIISYEPEVARWFLLVNGRNGLRVDNNVHKRGSKILLRNGCVIEINNTQMAFITTSSEDDNGPVWDATIIKQAQRSSEEDDDGEDDARNVARDGTQTHPSGSSQLQPEGMYQSHYSGQQHSYQSHQQRSNPHTHRAALQATPGTPMRAQTSFVKSSPAAANYSRGVMMESTESIDYSAESAKDLKPPHSYAQLIGMAILSTPEQCMALADIYQWIMSNYAFYRFQNSGWQNSIRHNLSLNKAFTKVPRRTDEPGKGMKWAIEPTEFDNFVQQGMKGCRRPNPIPGTQSTLGSPNSPVNRAKPARKDEDATPPLGTYQPSYPSALEAYTPERGPRRSANGTLGGGVGLGIDGNALVDYDYPQRATPRNGLNAIANAAGSLPALYAHEDARTGALDTPFPAKPSAQLLAPTSTLRRPSDFIEFSSPAPFWKLEGLVGSTPFKPFEFSPMKPSFPSLKKKEGEVRNVDEDEDGTPVDQDEEFEEELQEDKLKSKGSPLISSSSPPRPSSAGRTVDASPSFSRPATAVAKTLSQLANSGREKSAASEKTPPSTNGLGGASVMQQHTPPMTVSQSSQPAPRHELPRTAMVKSFESGNPNLNGSYGTSFNSGNSTQANGYIIDDAEEDGIDLVKGFQPIGTFHQLNHQQQHLAMAGGGSFGR